MDIFWTSGKAESVPGSSAVAVGNFDGIHLGHRALIQRACARGKTEGVPTFVLTFDPHPTKVLFPEKNLKNIFDIQDRRDTLLGLGVDAVAVEPFTKEFSQWTPEKFFHDLLIKQLGAKHLFVGHDFRFGKNRAGTPELLRKLCEQEGITLELVQPVKLNGETVSSTKIRQAITGGDVALARLLLQRPFYLRGTVEKGAARGRALGFPTANLLALSELFPKNGVYYTLAHIGGQSYPSLTNVGLNPTFATQNKRAIQVETYILKFNEDIYGESLKVEFLDYLRPEIKFESVEALVAEIKNDVKKAESFRWKTS